MECAGLPGLVCVFSPIFAPLVEIGVMFSLNLWNVRIGDQRTMPPLFTQGVFFFFFFKLVAASHSKRLPWVGKKLCFFVFCFKWLANSIKWTESLVRERRGSLLEPILQLMQLN